MSWGSDDTSSTCSHQGDNYEVFENKTALSQDLKFLSGMPELCDVMFLVGVEKVPVYGVRAILSIRSRVFYKMLFGPKSAQKPRSPGSPTGPQSVRKTITKLFETSHTSKDVSTNWKLAYPHNQQQHQSSTGLGQPHRAVVHIEDFEAEVFRDLVEYIHTGSVALKPQSLLGLLNAADHFSLEELRRVCINYSQKCISLETVCSLLVSAERYVQYKSTKIFLQKVLEFIDSRGDDVLQLPEFVHLPRHVVELILTRDELKATDLNKYRAVERWATNFVTSNYGGATLTAAMAPFLQYVQFHLVPTHVLMKEIRPMGIVPEATLLTALAYQADPQSVSQAELRLGQMSPRPVSRAKWPSAASGRSVSVEAELNVTPNDSLSRDSGFYEPTIVKVESFEPFILKIPFSRAKSQLELQSVSMKL